MSTQHHQKILDTVNQLTNNPKIAAKDIDEFKNILQNNTVLRDEDALKHYCSACFIVSLREKKLFLGEHIKAGLWLSAVGGHIDIGEGPEEAVRREYMEEVGVQAPHELELFDIVHFDHVGRPTCTDHFDFLYLARYRHIPNLEFDPKEFHKAAWLDFDEALKVPTFPLFHTKIQKLVKYLSS